MFTPIPVIPLRYRSWAVALLVTVVVNSSLVGAEPLRYATADSSDQVRYGLRQLEKALVQHGTALEAVDAAASTDLEILAPDATLGAEAYRIAHVGGTLQLRGGDARGLLYGLLDVAEELGRGTPLGKIERNERPPVGFRALKFNLPYAAYRNAPSLEVHQDVCRDPKFWEAFLDMMAANRFNVLTLWSLHPFHYFVVPKSFPEARSIPEAELQEFRALWTKLFAMARERGIETYLINWNIFVSPGFARAHQIAEYSCDWSFFGKAETSPLLEAYTRECVQQVIDEYPDLTGLGITQGERMGGMTPAERRAWVDRAIVPGIQAAKRPSKFIYRAPLSADTQSGGTTNAANDRATRAHIDGLGGNVSQPVLVEFKFNWSHGHSSPELFIVHGGKLSDAYWNPVPEKYQTVWTVRNEDFHVLRWGDPDFVRTFLQKNLAPHFGGVIVGSEVFIPAKDIVSLDGPHRTWRYDFQRQWLFYATWGRTLFSPNSGEAVVQGLLGDRFGADKASDLLGLWKEASRVPTRFASFVKGTWDGSLYTEAFGKWRDRDHSAEGIVLIDVQSLIDHPVLDPRYMNVAEFVAAEGKMAAGRISPLELADGLTKTRDEIAAGLARLRAVGPVKAPLEAELADLEAWAAFAQHFAEKLRGAVALARYQRTGDKAEQRLAIDCLRRALQQWNLLADAGARFNHGEILFQTSPPFSWKRLATAVEQDIRIAESAIFTP